MSPLKMSLAMAPAKPRQLFHVIHIHTLQRANIFFFCKLTLGHPGLADALVVNMLYYFFDFLTENLKVQIDA